MALLLGTGLPEGRGGVGKLSPMMLEMAQKHKVVGVRSELQTLSLTTLPKQDHLEQVT